MPRRSKAIPSESKGPPPTAASNPTSNARPRRQAREFLATSVLAELWSIWRADPRVPSIKSRRSWAISRNANPRLVDCWFFRRRACAKKSGQPIPNESYDLPLDAPIIPKWEQSVAATEIELDTVPDLPSDDTLVYPPDDDLNDVEASSDTILDETHIGPQKTGSSAYKELPLQLFPGHQEPQSELSSTDPDAAKDRSEEDPPSFNNLALPVCNQGKGKQFGFTCILCSENPTQDDVQSDSGAMSDLDRKRLFTSRPCLDFLPGLSALSAIPFLLRTPSTVFPDDVVSHQIVDHWMSIEEELGCLVNGGKLDFSFLDAPHLSSLELPD